MHMRFHRTWFLLATILFIVECLIAAFAHDRIVRPYLGDVLVVMLIFFAVLAFWPVPPLRLAIGVLLFAFAVEATQASGLIDRLGLSGNTLAKLLLGNTFQWGDLICYLIGSLVSLGIVRIAEDKRPVH